MLAIALLVPLAWLLGAFPTAILVARAQGRDVMCEGSGNPGASNIGRVLGWRWGALVLLADVTKGALAAGGGLAVGGRPGAYVLGLAAVVGHTFPLYRKGGKGVAAAGGTLLVLYPLITLGVAATWLVVAARCTRRRSRRCSRRSRFPLLSRLPVTLAGRRSSSPASPC